jgi:hypothetical protein
MKNPWLSMWLSAANSWAGTARGLWTAEMTRQQNALARGTAKRSPARGKTGAKRKTTTRSPRKSSR